MRVGVGEVTEGEVGDGTGRTESEGLRTRLCHAVVCSLTAGNEYVFGIGDAKWKIGVSGHVGRPIGVCEYESRPIGVFTAGVDRMGVALDIAMP